MFVVVKLTRTTNDMMTTTRVKQPMNDKLESAQYTCLCELNELKHNLIMYCIQCPFLFHETCHLTCLILQVH